MKILQTILTIFVSIFFTTSVLADAVPAPKEEGYMFVISPETKQVLEKHDSMAIAILMLRDAVYDSLTKNDSNETSDQELLYWDHLWYDGRESTENFQFYSMVSYLLKMHEEYADSPHFYSFYSPETQKDIKYSLQYYAKSYPEYLMANHNIIRKYEMPLFWEDRIYEGTAEDLEYVEKYIQSATFNKEFIEEFFLSVAPLFDLISSAGKISDNQASLDTRLISNTIVKFSIETYGQDEAAFIGSAIALSLEELYQKILDPNSNYFEASLKRAEKYKSRFEFFDNKLTLDRQ